MKCSNCKLWNPFIQDGTTIRDIKKDYKLFGKTLGQCCCNNGEYSIIPTFNYEICPLELSGYHVMNKLISK